MNLIRSWPALLLGACSLAPGRPMTLFCACIVGPGYDGPAFNVQIPLR